MYVCFCALWGRCHDSSEPVVAHALPVPLHTTEPAPLKLTLGPRTHHVHTATVFLNGDFALGAGPCGLVDGLLRGLIPARTQGRFLIHHVTLRSVSSFCGKPLPTRPLMVFLLTLTAKHKPAAQSVGQFTLHPAVVVLGQQTGPTAWRWTQHTPHPQHTLLRRITLVPLILLLAYNPEMMRLLNQRVWTPGCTWQRVAYQRVVNELSLVEAGDAVQVEAVQTDDMAICTLGYQHWTHDVSTGDTGDSSDVWHDEVQSYRCVLVTGGVGRTLQVELC